MSAFNGWDRFEYAHCICYRRQLADGFQIEASGRVQDGHIDVAGYFGGLNGRGTSLHVLAVANPAQLDELKVACTHTFGNLPIVDHDGRPL